MTRVQRPARRVARAVLLITMAVALAHVQSALAAGATKTAPLAAASGQQQQPQQQTQAKAAAEAPKQQQDSQSGASSQQQAAADKKQGDSIESLFNTDEYVQIKPEELGALGEPGKELEAALALADLPASEATKSAGAAAGRAEHKSADDELNAHLAQDSIGALESGSRMYTAPVGRPADPRAARPAHYAAPAQQPRAGYRMPPPPPPAHAMPPMGAYGRAPRSPHGPPPPPPPASYGMPPRNHMPVTMALKGKIADSISSIVPHVARPYAAGAMPLAGPIGHMANAAMSSAYSAAGSPRYLPRGAAAGYAAFREFVRAQANRYKQQGAPEPLAYNAAPPSGPNYGAPAGHNLQMSTDYGRPPRGLSGPPAGGPYGALAPPPPPAAYEPPKMAEQPAPYAMEPAAKYQQQQQQPPPPPPKAKVTVAQAYIPHLTPQAPAADAYKPEGHEQAANYNGGGAGGQHGAALAKLYGGHAPEGAGRPEYNKDYGMVIHYPQATVYTEPMTVEQVHKLAGSSITQILEHLQYNIASGQRDESNTIRANNKHHLGHGLTIHAKEYYAPGKGGHYVPTTAAVISHAGPGGKSYATGAEEAAAGGYGSAPGSVSGAYGANAPTGPADMAQGEPAGYNLKPELGSGYERVKAAVAASSNRYNMPPKPVEPAHPMQAGAPPASYNGQQPQQQYQQQQQQPQQQGGKYEPLGAIASLIGGELESLYNKANSVLSKQIDPEIHAQVQAHLKSLTKQMAGPLKYSEHDHRSPLMLRPYGASEGRSPRPHGNPPPSNHAHPRPHHGGPPAHMRARAPRRPHHAPPPPPRQHAAGRHPSQGGHPHHQRPAAGPRPQAHNYGQQQQQQPQQQQYNSAEQQAFQQQVAQLMHDFQSSDEQYQPKGHPGASSQGYPSKVMQKYQQQQQQHQAQQQQQQYQAAMPYEHTDGLELPQGPNDQIGEISELMEALKGTLEAHKPEAAPSGGAYASGKDGGAKMEDVRYLTSALGQIPSYAIQVPVGHPQQQQAGEGAAYESTRKGEQQQQQYGQQQAGYQQAGYQQQQPQPQQQQQQGGYQAPQQQQQPQQPNYGLGQTEQTAYQMQDGAAYAAQQQQPQQQQAAPPASYNQPQAYSVHSHEMQVNHVAPQPQQAPAYSPAAPAAPAQADSYGQQQQQLQPAGDYQQQPQHAQPPMEMPSSGGYAPPASSQAHQVQQQTLTVVDQPIVQQPQPQQQQQAYSSSEHAQVINHIVPVQQPQQQHQAAAGAPSGDGYGSEQQQSGAQAPGAAHPPANQITLAEPSDSQYQQAQSLSSFVDSLPNDYQELLRQPAGHAAMLEGAASNQHDSTAPARHESGLTKIASSTSSGSPSISASSKVVSAASSSSLPSSSSHRHSSNSDYQAAASSVSSSYSAPAISAKAAAYHSKSSSSSSSSSSPSSSASSSQSTKSSSASAAAPSSSSSQSSSSAAGVNEKR